MQIHAKESIFCFSSLICRSIFSIATWWARRDALAGPAIQSEDKGGLGGVKHRLFLDLIVFLYLYTIFVTPLSMNIKSLL